MTTVSVTVVGASTSDCRSGGTTYSSILKDTVTSFIGKDPCLFLLNFTGFR